MHSLALTIILLSLDHCLSFYLSVFLILSFSLTLSVCPVLTPAYRSRLIKTDTVALNVLSSDLSSPHLCHSGNKNEKKLKTNTHRAASHRLKDTL